MYAVLLPNANTMFRSSHVHLAHQCFDRCIAPFYTLEMPHTFQTPERMRHPTLRMTEG